MPARVSCKCCNQLSEGHLMVTCSLCKDKYKHSCVDITSNEVRTLNANKGYNWTCLGCRAIGNDLKDLRALIIDLQREIKELRAENTRTVNTGIDMEEIIYEITERQKRKNNIVLFNIPEPDQRTSKSLQAESDKNVVADILTEVSPEISADNIKPVRLGTFSDSKSRPVKIKLENLDIIKTVLKNAKKLKSNQRFKNIYITVDRTKNQLEQYRKVRQELAERINAGETNCRIKYVNGVPKVTLNQ